VASLFLVIFSIGVAIGSVAINALLKGDVSARYAPVSVLFMGAFVAAFWLVCHEWAADGRPGDLMNVRQVTAHALGQLARPQRHAPFSVLFMGAFVAAFWLVCHEWAADVRSDDLMNVGQFLAQPLAPLVLLTLLLIAVSGGMFVVPLYAFLTTKCDPSVASRMVAANNIVNSGAMVIGSLIAVGLSSVGVPVVEQLLLSAGMCLISAWLGMRLHQEEKLALAS